MNVWPLFSVREDADDVGSRVKCLSSCCMCLSPPALLCMDRNLTSRCFCLFFFFFLCAWLRAARGSKAKWLIFFFFSGKNFPRTNHFHYFPQQNITINLKVEKNPKYPLTILHSCAISNKYLFFNIILDCSQNPGEYFF